jgi:hypothetical protein
MRLPAQHVTATPAVQHAPRASSSTPVLCYRRAQACVVLRPNDSACLSPSRRCVRDIVPMPAEPRPPADAPGQCGVGAQQHGIILRQQEDAASDSSVAAAAQMFAAAAQPPPPGAAAAASLPCLMEAFAGGGSADTRRYVSRPRQRASGRARCCCAPARRGAPRARESYAMLRGYRPLAAPRNVGTQRQRCAPVRARPAGRYRVANRQRRR